MSRSRSEAGRQRELIEIKGRWYFKTRERIIVGPFETREDAISGAEELTKRLADPTTSARPIIIEFMLERCS